jgi:hypothetical protein
MTRPSLALALAGWAKNLFKNTRHESTMKPLLSQVADKDIPSPSFVGKLFAMLGDQRAMEHIYWSSCGESIVIPDPGQFSSHVLPMLVSL